LEGRDITKTRDDFFTKFNKSIDGAYTETGGSSALGQQKVFEMKADAARQEKLLIKEGKDPHTLYDPSSPNFIGRPENLSKFSVTLKQAEDYNKQQLTMGPVSRAITTAAESNGLNPTAFRRMAQLESGLDPLIKTGSYKGLFQLSEAEFSKRGGTNILDSTENASAAGQKMAEDAGKFQIRYGRPATVFDAYMIHQQGEDGYRHHMADPQAPAWQNMAATGEGQQRGEKWAKAAIWGNIPVAERAQFGSVENVTSQEFMNVWAKKLGSSSSTPILAGTTVQKPLQVPTGMTPEIFSTKFPKGTQFIIPDGPNKGKIGTIP